MQREIKQYNEIKNDYFHFILFALAECKKLIKITSPWTNIEIEPAKPFDYKWKKKFWTLRCKHVLVMTLLGVIGEHLTKLILLKYGININKASNSDKLITFGEAKDKFKKHIIKKQNKYFNGLKSYKFSDYEFFNRKKLNPNGCLDLLVELRNKYIHYYPGPKGEARAIPWYIYNFLIFLIKKEFNKEDFIKNSDRSKVLTYIGDKEVKECFN
jgi:hypothetical protein